MLKIKHFPRLDSKTAQEFYSRKDGVNCIYVCTTELKPYGNVYDIFFRPTPHPEYGNRYFGLTSDGSGNVYICNADSVENLGFGCVSNDKNEWTYSQYAHDFLNWGSGFIDGGRAYARYGGSVIPTVKFFKVKDGEFVECES